MNPPEPLNKVLPVEADDPLTWDDSYAIALALKQQHPGINLENISLNMIFNWTVSLPNFKDDKELANDAILQAIFNEWYEATVL